MSELHTAMVRQQFNRQVTHYLAKSAMADRGLLDAIFTAAPAEQGQRVLDVACGAGFLLRTYREAGAEVFGVELSEAMLREASRALGPSVAPEHLLSGDAAQLPFEAETFDIVTCKLAFHYFSDPLRAIQEMARVCRASGRVVLIDRVTCDDPNLGAAQNRLEKLRTPNKVRVYAEMELIGMLLSGGLTVVGRELLLQPMPFVEWMAAAGALDGLEQARSLLTGEDREDPTGLAPWEVDGQLMIHHRTLIVVAKPSG